MAVNKLLVPAACLIAGVAIGAFALPGPYAYGESKGVHYRVNRFTGVEQYASSKGWVSQQELVAEGMDSFFGGMRRAVNGAGTPTTMDGDAPSIGTTTAGGRSD